MKKLFYSMFAFAMAAMTLTSCEDVPMPYDMPVINPDGGEDVSGKGTESDPYDVASAIAKASQEKVFVKGYIVGYVSGQVFSEGATFSTSGEVSATNLLLAASANETDASKCMPVQLPSGTVRTGLNLKDNPGNLKKEVLLYGDIATYFGVPGFKNTSYAKIDGKDVGNKPGGGDTPTPSTGVYSMDFKSKGQGEWTISDKTKPSEIASIWKYDNRYGMVATAYASSVNYDSESMLVSPKFNLTGVSKATLKIRHAINFFLDIDTAKKQALVLASTDGTNWTELTLSNWPTSLGWTFFDATADMTSFAGKSNVQIALKYISTATKAGTWEIESVSVE